MNHQWEEAKKEYEEIPIPDELEVRVRQAIEHSGRKQQGEYQKESKVISMKKQRIWMKRGLVAAAALTITFTGALNTSTAFAETVSQLPVLGAVARVLTFTSYEKEENDMKIAVTIPKLEVISGELKGLDQSINKEVQELCQKYADEAVKRAEEYREAFLATGGTKEEWAAHKIEIKVWYEILSQKQDYLSLSIQGSENWNSAGGQAKYYTIDLMNGKLVTLKDLLGEDYINQANETILSQIPEKEQETGMEFFTAEEGGFTTITEETPFYVNEAGNPVIVFEKYEIAPGAAGVVEFEIAR